MRIDKFLSHLKYGSRKEIKDFLHKEVVLVNNTRIFNVAHIIDPTLDNIMLNGVKIFYQDPIHLMINKPEGYLSVHRDPIHPCIMSLLKEPYSRFDYVIAGRLDLDASGLLILTSDGQFAHQIMSPRHHIEKIYQVELNKHFRNQKKLLEGVIINDGGHQSYHAKALRIESEENRVTITIDEGKFHQVKRIFIAVGYEVISLKRIQIGKLKLEDLSPGAYAPFRKEDLYD
ncbi:MAG: rRNA pseudouridine synthase [Acholeplasmataceae bacterium]|nr:rRNA pseudouridine synthase [Acholeplasmataceae bacterium]